MASTSSRGGRARSRAQIWKVSVLVLLPVLILMGLAAKASTSVERPAHEAPAPGR
jgi:hypothetical protein